MTTRSVRRLGRLLAALGFVLALLAPAVAFAQTGYPTPTPPAPPATPPVQPPTVVVSPASTGLAFTGGNIAVLVGVGMAAVAGGVVLVRTGRRRHATTY